ncbi:ATP-dependent RNA helicase DBP10 [Rhodotorula paludigena]|uniref:ATP-dependent RNA helicase DBP10 n=1 Tax=Rhodotorula paludigena TaxID=86838 RepID=UPI003177B8F5
MDSDSDSSAHVDISSALLGAPSSRPKKLTKTRATALTKGSASARSTAEDQAEQDALEADDEDALFASLSQLQHSRNLAEGAALVRKGKDAKQQKGLTGGGSFQALGLPPLLLKTLLQRGFTTPTPIQRLALPSILGSTEQVVTDKGKKVTVARDHLCMARTGSGKTLCYLLPLLSQLWTHSDKFGARGLILVPTRELALQVLKVGKDLARGIKGEGESLRWAMVVGGEAMETQFEIMSGNPDVIIATPGRFLHVLVEMAYSLSSIQSLIIDEADRLFELGFAEQLHEILHRVPATRQTLLFSATLPSSLVGFAKAGLQNPKLIRLDVDQKISKDLQMAYLDVKTSEKEAVLLGLLREVIQVPVMNEQQRVAERARVAAENEAVMKGTDGRGQHHGGGGKKGKGKQRDDARGKKRKRGADGGGEGEGETETVNGAEIAPHQTVVFVSTKHHVEYLANLLAAAHYSVSAIYGSMDQTARKISLARFRSGQTSILVVTDLAARGIDVPGVENVVNYDFPNGTRAFVHRVGRTARAGRTGWAYTFVTPAEMPYLLDLELFLTRPLKLCPLTPSSSAPSTSAIAAASDDPDFAQTLIFGTPPRSLTDIDLETHRALLVHAPHLENLQGVAQRGQRMYERGLGKASPESYRRAKEMARKKAEEAERTGLVGIGEEHPVYDAYIARAAGAAGGGGDAREAVERAKEAERSRADLLAKISGFRPPETVFEVSAKGKNGGSEGSIAMLMKERRRALGRSARARDLVRQVEEEELPALPEGALGDADEMAEVEQPKPVQQGAMDDADEEELEAVFGKKPAKRAKPAGDRPSWRDERFYMGYEQEGAATEAGYSLTNGDSFVAQAAQSTYDIGGRGDTEGTPAEALAQRASTLKWDRKSKKFIRADQVGADNKKLIRSESGQRLPASFKAGVFDEWQKKTRVRVPRVGDQEIKGRSTHQVGGGAGGRRFVHKAGTPKADGASSSDGKGKHAKRRVGQADKPHVAPGGLRSAAEIRKERIAKEKRVRRSTQPSKKNPKGKGGSMGGGDRAGGKAGGARGGAGGGRGAFGGGKRR